MKISKSWLLFIFVISLVILSYNVIKGCHMIEHLENSDIIINGVYDIIDCSNNYRNDCYNVKYIDYMNNVKQTKGRISVGYFVDPSGYVQTVKGLYDVMDCSNNPKGDCYSVNYINSLNVKSQTKGRLYFGFWIDPSGFVQQVPYGNRASPDKRSYVPKTKDEMYDQAATKSNAPTTLPPNIPPLYDSNNYRMQYHDDTNTIIKNASDNNTGVVWVVKNGKLTGLPQSDVSTKGSMLFYQPGSYKFGPSTYVPDYEDSVFMSRLTRQSYATPITSTTSSLGGICNQYKDSPEQLEQACRSVDKKTCASTSCCVLLGGGTCVSGDEKGPTMKGNYNDPAIPKRDFYYYQGNCYGNCSNTFEYGSAVSNSNNLFGEPLNSYSSAYGNQR